MRACGVEGELSLVGEIVRRLRAGVRRALDGRDRQRGGDAKPNLQLQLGVSRSLKRDMTGSFYVGKPGYPEAGQAKTVAQLMRPQGDWNHFRVEARGTTFTVWINGQPASQYTDEKFFGPAPLGLQIHGGLKMKVEYRDIRLAEL